MIRLALAALTVALLSSAPTPASDPNTKSDPTGTVVKKEAPPAVQLNRCFPPPAREKFKEEWMNNMIDRMINKTVSEEFGRARLMQFGITKEQIDKAMNPALRIEKK